MSKKIFLLIFFVFFLTNSEAKEQRLYASVYKEFPEFPQCLILPENVQEFLKITKGLCTTILLRIIKKQ